MTEAVLLASGLAALISRSIMHPMDTLRLRLQVGAPISVLGDKNLLQVKNLASLYSGYSIAVGFTIPGLTVFLTSYELTKSTLARYTKFKVDHTLNHCMSGFVAQGLAGVVFNPMEVVKGYLQTQGTSPPPMRQVVRSIFQTQGLTGFFRGYWLSVAVFGPHNIIYFATYERLKKQFQSYNSQSLELKHFLMASSAATLLGATATHPIDVIRARFQIASTAQSMTLHASDSKQVTSVRKIVLHMWQNEGGFRPFVRGLVFRAGYLVPSTAISMTMFESFKSLFLQMSSSQNPSSVHLN